MVEVDHPFQILLSPYYQNHIDAQSKPKVLKGLKEQILLRKEKKKKKKLRQEKDLESLSNEGKSQNLL